MLFSKKDSKLSKNTSHYDVPFFGSRESASEIPKERLGEKSISPKLAYRLISDELLDEGSARLNLATFCQTSVEDEAFQIMSETLDKNAIDKTEYPQTAELERRCVHMLSSLWNVKDEHSFIGTSTAGSSEACMLAGMAMKFCWRSRAEKLGLDISKKPNLIISSGYQVCWEKFCVYWDIELRCVPIALDCMGLNPEKVLDYVDEYTIGIVGILGITYTGQFDDIEGLDKVLSEYNKTTPHTVKIHVDAASGGLFAPFVDPDLKWDFRLENVISINASGHKYGLVYPGVGWIMWADKKYLPEELIFNVDYLGGKMPTMTLNFSRPASQIIGQYYNFLSLGLEGYRQIHQKTRDIAYYLSREIEKIGLFRILQNGTDLPVICYELKAESNRKWNLYDLSDRLRMCGWQVPAYPLPKNLENILIQRIVCRQDLSYDMAEIFMLNFRNAISELDQARVLIHEEAKDKENKVYGFTH